MKRTKKSKKTAPNSSYVIIGFDTEYKTPDHPLELEEIKAGKGNYRVLSYQFHCETSGGLKWSGIACPKADERMSFGQFLVFALASGIRDTVITKLPTTIYLVGHFTRADVPAFSDFKDHLTKDLNNVRNTFISVDQYVAVDIKYRNEAITRLKVTVRDTMLLSPADSKSLSALGELVDAPKIILDKDKKKDLYFKQNMDVLRRTNWDLFFVDETRTLGKSRELITAAGELPGHGASLWTFWQDRSQIFSVYGDHDAATLLRSAEFVTVSDPAMVDPDEREYWSRALSDFTVLEETKVNDKTAQGQHTSSSQAPRAARLMTTEELGRLPSSELILFPNSSRYAKRPLRLHKTRFDDQRLVGLTAPVPPVGPTT